VVQQAGEEVVVDVAVGAGDGVGVGEGEALLLGEERTRGVAVEGEQLLVRDAQVAADGSVDVLSELAAVEGGDPPVDEGDEAGVEEARSVEAAPHRAGAAEDGRSPGVEEVVEEGRTPFSRLGRQHALDRLLGVIRVDPLDPWHRSPLPW